MMVTVKASLGLEEKLARLSVASLMTVLGIWKTEPFLSRPRDRSKADGKTLLVLTASRAMRAALPPRATTSPVDIHKLIQGFF